MATNKVVTVTVASVVTGDTLEGYNFYSDQEGATPLNGGTVVTPANAAAGQTYALTDGVVHSVTAKPVGVSNGEFSAVVSNAVSVDLTSTDVVFWDSDTSGFGSSWSSSGGTITYNNGRIQAENPDGLSATDFTVNNSTLPGTPGNFDPLRKYRFEATIFSAEGINLGQDFFIGYPPTAGTGNTTDTIVASGVVTSDFGATQSGGSFTLSFSGDGTAFSGEVVDLSRIRILDIGAW